MAYAKIMRGLNDSKVMAPPAPNPAHGVDSVPVVRMLIAHDLASDGYTWMLDSMAVNGRGELKQHTVRGGARPLTAAAVGEGLMELGALLKADG